MGGWAGEGERVGEAEWGGDGESRREEEGRGERAEVDLGIRGWEEFIVAEVVGAPCKRGRLRSTERIESQFCRRLEHAEARSPAR